MEGRATAQVYATNIAPLTDPNKVGKLVFFDLSNCLFCECMFDASFVNNCIFGGLGGCRHGSIWARSQSTYVQ